jgi:hypothetical protein
MNNDFFESLPYSINAPHNGGTYTPMVCDDRNGSLAEAEWLAEPLVGFLP